MMMKGCWQPCGTDTRGGGGRNKELRNSSTLQSLNQLSLMESIVAELVSVSAGVSLAADHNIMQLSLSIFLPVNVLAGRVQEALLSPH